MSSRIIYFTLLLLAMFPSEGAQAEILFREEFIELSAWQDQHFSKVAKSTEFKVSSHASAASVLRVESLSSASGLVHSTRFDPKQYPKLRWRWRVEKFPEVKDYRLKAGDDYALRVFVMFPYVAGELGLLERAKFSTAKLLYGSYPPMRTISYVWASRIDLPPYFESPYSSRAILVPLRRGLSVENQFNSQGWFEEEVDMVSDYRRLFGDDIPAEVQIAVMGDSDDSQSEGLGYLDWIEVRK